MVADLFQWRSFLLLGMISVIVGGTARAPQGKEVAAWTEGSIKSQGKVLQSVAEKNPAGIATSVLEKLPGHSIMLTVRTKNGRAEMHKQDNDIIFVIDGAATMMTGGTIVNEKETAPEETRGSQLMGGVPTDLKKGDIMHIPPGIPHQTLVAPGKVFTYYVVKVTQE